VADTSSKRGRDKPPRDPEPIEPAGIAADDALVDPLGEGPIIARMASLFRRESFRQRMLTPLGVDALILITNLTTGVIVARALGPSGRGELAAALLVSQIAAWTFSVGSTEAISFHHSRHPEDARRLLSSWLAVTVPLSIAAVAGSVLLLPTLFAAQTNEAIELSQLYMATVPLILLQGVFHGIVLGDEDFNFYNLTRFVTPAIAALSYAGLLIVDDFTVEMALVANGVANLVCVVMLTFRALRRHPLTRVDIPLLKGSMWYGLKAHGGSIGSIVNARLDLLIIPAFLSAASVGLYSVATNVSSILPVLTGTVALMLLPVAARQQGSARTVILTLQATFAIAIAIAVPIAILAPIALELIYGSGFEEAALPLRLLLPGAVAQAGVMVLWSGLLAADRPFLASAAIAPAAVVTVVGLIIFLPRYGINAAAIITTVVYVAEVLALAVLYRRTLGIKWRDFVRAPAT
jgi:O-antigen/teichoic acid export membrane protein